MAQTVKNPPAKQVTWVQSLGQEDPLEKEVATYSSIFCLDNPMDRRAWQAIVHGIAKELDTTWRVNSNNNNRQTKQPPENVFPHENMS